MTTANTYLVIAGELIMLSDIILATLMSLENLLLIAFGELNWVLPINFRYHFKIILVINRADFPPFFL